MIKDRYYLDLSDDGRWMIIDSKLKKKSYPHPDKEICKLIIKYLNEAEEEK